MPHIAEPEGPTTRLLNYVLQGFGEKKKKEEDWPQMLPQVPKVYNLCEYNICFILSVILTNVVQSQVSMNFISYGIKLSTF